MSDNLSLICGKSATGKAQPLHCTIKTPNGDLYFGDAKVGMEIYGEDGKVYKITAITPQGIRPAYRVTFNDHSSTVCAAEHLWAYNTVRKNRKNKFPQTIKETKDMIGKNMSGKHFQIPEPLEMKEKNLPIPPYLLGALIGDGYLSGHNVSISAKNPEIINKITPMIEKNHSIKKCSGDNYSWNIVSSVNGYNFYIRELSKLEINVTSAEKYIPKQYLHGSTKQRFDLLCGLFDTDGCVGKDNSLSYATTSIKLANDIVLLCRTLGIKSWIGHVDTRSKYTNNGRCYSVRMSINNNQPVPFTLSKHLNRYSKPKRFKYNSRQLKSIEYVGNMEMLCITTSNPSGLYITDDYIVTHNSASLMFLANQERVVYLRCEPKKLPFKHSFKEIIITDPYQVHAAFDQLEDNTDFDTVVIDSSTFLMDMFETKHILTLANKMEGWQAYQTFWKTLLQQKIASTAKNVIILAHTKDQLNEKEMAMETFVPVKGALAGVGIESYFSCVLATKKVSIKDLTDYTNDLLTITPEEEALGYKHVFQTKLTKETVGERIRGPLDMFSANETYIDNNAQYVIDRLESYYGD